MDCQSIGQPPVEEPELATGPSLLVEVVVVVLAVCSLCDGHARAIPAVRRTTKLARAAVIGLAP